MRLSRRAAIGLIATTLFIACSVYAWNRHRDRIMSHQLFSSPMRTLCVGRYLIDVPAQYELESYDYRIDGVDIMWQYSIRNEEEFRKKLIEREAELKNDKNDYGNVSLEQSKELSSENFAGRLFVFGRSEPATWYENGKSVSSEQGLTGEAWLWIGGHAVQLIGKDLGPSNVNNVVRLAMPLRALAANEVPSEPGFCMEMLDARAMIVGLPGRGQNEKSEVQFGLKDHPDVKFDFTMYTNGDKLDEPLHVRSARADSEMADLMHLVSKLRNGPRTIHGIEGDEEVESVRELNGAKVLGFGWEPLGRPNDPLAPSITFDMKTGYSHDGPVQSSLSDAVALQLWDAVVGSIRLRPTSQTPAKTSEAGPKSKVPLGSRIVTNTPCPQTGWWHSPDEGPRDVNSRRFFRQGESMPTVMEFKTPSTLERLRGIQPKREVVTVWKLVAYEDRQPSADPSAPNSGKKDAG